MTLVYHYSRTHRGIALLIALASVIVVLTVIGMSLRAVAQSQRALVIDSVHERQRDLLLAGETMVLSFIQRQAETLVMPPAGGALALTDDRLIFTDGVGQLRVWLYDGLAGLPPQTLTANGAMRMALPARWNNLTIQPGLSGPALVEQITLPHDRHRYPHPTPGPSIAWSPPTVPIPADLARAVHQPDSLSLVEVVAVTSDGRINRNTAPPWLLEAVYRLHGDDGLNEALQLRERGLFNDRNDPEDRQPVRLVAVSNRWQALIEATWNGRQRRWWIEMVGNADEVKIVQRHDVDE